MNINLLKTYLALVKHELNFTLAAKSMGISQPAVTKNIKTLEEIMGMTLFMRKGRKRYQLTDKGSEILPLVKSIVEQTHLLLSDNGGLVRKKVFNIATTHTQIKYKLPKVVCALLKKYPGLTIKFHLLPADMMAKVIATNTMDIAITEECVTVPDDVLNLPCYRWGRYLVVQATHPLAEVGEVSLSELTTYPLVTGVFHDGKEELYDMFREHNLKPEIAVSVTDDDIIRHYVNMGIGAGIISTVCREGDEYTDNRGLRYRHLEHLLPGGYISLLVNKNKLPDNITCEFIRLFAPHVSESTTYCFDALRDTMKRKMLPWQ